MGATTLPTAQAVAEGLERALSAQWRELLRQRRLVQEGGEREAVHDLRVASRRLRALIELVTPGIGTGLMRRLRRPVRRLTRKLGQLRNLDEARHYLTGLQEAGLAPLVRQLERQRRQEGKQVGRLLHELPVKRLERLLEQAVQRLHDQTAPARRRVVSRLADRSLALYRPIHQLQLVPELAELAEERHTLRIAVKKWRYFNELLDQALGRRPGQPATLLKQYQGLLGELNDRELFLIMVRETDLIDQQTRQRVLHTIKAQHRQLVEDFKRLQTRQPLQYQFLA